MLISDVTLRGERILVSIPPQETMQDGIYTGKKSKVLRSEIELYFSEIEKTAVPLDFSVGTRLVIFNRLGGYIVPTTEKYCKIITPYDIVGTMDKKTKKIYAGKGRVLLRVPKVSLVDSDGIFNAENGDPRNEDLRRGVVLDCGADVTDLPLNANVAFDAWAGSVIGETDSNEELMLVYEKDITFYTK